MRMRKRFFRTRLLLSTLGLCSLLVPLSSAQAASVTYSFKGNIGPVNGQLPPTITQTSAVSGSFQFENATSGTTSPHVGNFPGAVTGVNLAIGGYTASYTLGSNAITLWDNVGFGDRWRLATELTGNTISGYTPVGFELRLDNENGGAFSGTSLQNPPSLASLTGTRWRLFFEDGDGNFVRIQGALNNLTAVPLPTAVLLFGAGLVSLVGLGAGGLRNLRGSRA